MSPQLGTSAVYLERVAYLGGTNPECLWRSTNYLGQLLHAWEELALAVRRRLLPAWCELTLAAWGKHWPGGSLIKLYFLPFC